MPSEFTETIKRVWLENEIFLIYDKSIENRGACQAGARY